LALRTQIPPDAWVRAGGRFIATAFELLAEQDRLAAEEAGEGGRVVMSG
jgi:hypothetical protein